MNAGITTPLLPSELPKLTNGKFEPARDFDTQLTLHLRDFESQVKNILNLNVTTLASAVTIVPQSSIVHVTGTAQIKTISVPKGVLGQLWLIPAAAFTTATGGNIAKASTAVANQLLIMVYDGSQWFPSY